TMLDDTKPTRQRAASEPAGSAADVLATGQNAVDGWLEGMHSLSGEMSALAQARVRFVTEAWADLAGCRSPEHIISCHARGSARPRDLPRRGRHARHRPGPCGPCRTPGTPHPPPRARGALFRRPAPPAFLPPLAAIPAITRSPHTAFRRPGAPPPVRETARR